MAQALIIIAQLLTGNHLAIAQQRYIIITRQLHRHAYLLLTECGLAARAQMELPGKVFIGPCFECKYMKSNTLEDVRRVLASPEPEDIVEISPEVRAGALRCIDNMFKYAEQVKD